ncbi:MAG: putative bifunctional diguanylate cyclase/phosphodiesterase [Dehalococcoidia bacterium]
MSRRTKAQLWTYVAGVGVVALALFATFLHELDDLDRRDLWLGAVLLLITPVAEMLVVHVHIRKSAHSFSLLELPLTLGLIAIHPLALITTYTIGSGAVLLVHRRQPPMKLLFNAGTLCLTASFAALVYGALPHGGSATAPTAWGAAVGAAICASVVGSLLVAGVIAIAEQRLAFGDLRRSVVIGLATSFGSASLGVTLAIVSAASPFALPLAALPLVAVFLANRSYEAERQRRESLQLVFDTSRELREGAQSDDGLFAALDRCYESLPCDYVKLYVPVGSSGTAELTIDASGQHRTLIPRDRKLAVLEMTAGGDQTMLLERPRSPEDAAANWPRLVFELDDPELAQALVAPLSSGAETLGTLVVASRGGGFRRFGDADLNLMQTIANGIASHTRLARLAFEDGLTGLPNRRRLVQELDRYYAAGAAGERVFLLIDMDDFKGINDTFGHAMGDAVLVEAAARLRAALPGGLVARLGGDEFAALVDPSGEPWQAVAERVLEAFVPPLNTQEGEFSLRMSVGVALAHEADSASILLRNADTALYEAKRLGKGRAQAFNQTMHDRVARKYAMTDALRSALGSGELVTFLQPVVRLSDRSIVGAEALSRWDSAQLGRVSPAEFVELADELGLSGVLTQHVAATLGAYGDALPRTSNFTLSVNVSPGDLADAAVVESLIALAKRLAPRTVAIEITEQLLVDDPEAATHLGALRDGGVRVYLDDFGTGYSSLSYLRRLPVDLLKVPRDFIREIEDDERSLALVRAIVGMGRSLGMDVIAEGIETEAQAALLTGLGVTHGQGYLFSPAVSLTEFARLPGGRARELAA